MKKPSKNYWQDIGSQNLTANYQGKLKVSELQKAVEFFPKDSWIEIDTSYNEKELTYTLRAFLQKEYSADKFAELMAEYELYQKLNLNKKLLTEKQELRAALRRANVGSEELIVAKNKLASFVGNDKIPPVRKQEIVNKWKKTVQSLEKKVSLEDTELLKKVNEEIVSLQEDISLQEEISKLDDKNYQSCDCLNCKLHHPDEEANDSDYDEFD